MNEQFRAGMLKAADMCYQRAVVRRKDAQNEIVSMDDRSGFASEAIAASQLSIDILTACEEPAHAE